MRKLQGEEKREEDVGEEEDLQEKEAEGLGQAEKMTRLADSRGRAINEESLKQSTESCKMKEILMLV